MLNIAVNDEILHKNPTRKIEVPVLPGFQPTKVDILTPDEVFALLDEFNEPFSTMFRITVDAGLRASEVAGLRVCDIDLDRREIHVVQQVDKAGALAAVKNYKKRTVEMPDDLYGPLKKHLAKIGVNDRERLVFLTPTGKSYRGKNLTDNMRRTVRRLTEPRGRWVNRSTFRPRMRRQASTGHKFTWHDGRHFYVSLLIAQGVDVAQVRAAVGHSSSKVTLDIYTHLWPRPSGSQRRAVDAVMNRSAVAAEQDSEGDAKPGVEGAVADGDLSERVDDLEHEVLAAEGTPTTS
ncbi:site-specific integrase [Nocardia sp. NPDC049220]|uniref:tyrosine-type recombinase/integrase n=1 Tax=Nocardia sp. NPDC049220 TaxID=3155273 RepID=UPI0033C9EB08